jgi:hypothetical protein
MQRAAILLLWPFCLYHIFRHYLINGKIFGKNFTGHKSVYFNSLCNFYFETFLILIRIQQDIVMNVKTSSCKVPVILVGFYWKLSFLDIFFWKKLKHQVLLKSVQWKPSRSIRIDRRTIMTKLIVYFCNFANAPENRPNRCLFWDTRKRPKYTLSAEYGNAEC